MVSIPVLPSKMYYLSKIHKAGKSMVIASNVNSPTYLLSKWLSDKFNHLALQPSDFSIKN